MTEENKTKLQKIYKSAKVPEGFSKYYTAFNRTTQGKYLQRIEENTSLIEMNSRSTNGNKMDFEQQLHTINMKKLDKIWEMLGKRNDISYVDTHNKNPVFFKSPIFSSPIIYAKQKKKQNNKKKEEDSSSLYSKKIFLQGDARNYDPNYNSIYKKTPFVSIIPIQEKKEVPKIALPQLKLNLNRINTVNTPLNNKTVTNRINAITEREKQHPLSPVNAKTEREKQPPLSPLKAKTEREKQLPLSPLKAKTEREKQLPLSPLKGLDFDKTTPRKGFLELFLSRDQLYSNENVTEIDYDKIYKMKKINNYVLNYDKKKSLRNQMLFATNDGPSPFNYSPKFNYIQSGPKSIVHYGSKIKNEETKVFGSSLKKRIIQRFYDSKSYYN